MSIPLKQKLTLEEFEKYVDSYNFGTLPPKFLVIHHTFIPDTPEWHGKDTLDRMDIYYRSKGWGGRGPHCFIAEDGIWLFTPMFDVGIHAGKGNGGLNEKDGYSVGIEVVGFYDEKLWTGKTKENSLGAIEILINKLNLSYNKIKFHNEFSSKTCPGKMITKKWLLGELFKYRALERRECKNCIELEKENRDLSNRLQKAKDFMKNI